MNFTNSLAKGIDNGDTVHILDFSKEFDKVAHERLLNKLNQP